MLVVPGGTSRRQGLKQAAQVRLTSPGEVLGTLPTKLTQQTAQFVDQNRYTLLRYWSCDLDTRQAFDLLERV